MKAEFKKTILEVLYEYPEIQFATVFGSIGRGKEKSGSDVDVAVAADNALGYEKIAELQSQLVKVLHKEVDVLDLQKVAGVILKEALHDCVVILNKKPALYAYLIKKLVYNQEDMMRYHRRILQERRARFLK